MPVSSLDPTGHRRQEDHGRVVTHRRLEALERPDVLAAEVDVDEGAEVPVLVELRPELRVPLDEVLDHVAHGLALRLELAGAADVGAEHRWDANARHAS